MASPSSIQAGQAFIRLTLNDAELQTGLAKASKLVDKFARGAAQTFMNLATAHYSLKNIFSPIAQTYASFDDQMRLAGAVTSATAEQFAMLSDRAKQLGRDTAFSASEVAGGMTALGRMGFAPAQIDQAIASVMNLSRATGTELSSSADIAANSMRIFGLQASQMSQVADVLTATANGSAQTLSDLFEALKNAGPQAAAAKESIQDVSAAIGVMANLGIKGSQAGTALRSAYMRMASAGGREYLRGFNIETTDANGNLRKMKDIILDIGKAMQGMGSAEKISFAQEAFGMRGAFVGLSLGGNVGEMQEFIDKLAEIDGQAASTASDMESGLGGALRLLKSSLEALVIAIGQSLEGFLSFGAGIAANVFGSIASLIQATPQLSAVFTGMGALLVPLAAGLMGLALAMKGASLAAGLCSTAVTGLQAALTMLAAHPIVATLMLVAGGLLLLIGRMRLLGAEVKKAADEQARLNAELQKQQQLNAQKSADTTQAGGQMQRLQELAELSRQQRLTNAEIIEADRLMQQLEPFGAGHFAQLDAIAGKLTLATDAQRQFTRAANEARLPGLQTEREQMQANIEAIKAERDAMIKRNGVKRAMQNMAIKEQAQIKIDAAQARLQKLDEEIAKLQEPIELDIVPPDTTLAREAIENAGQSIGDLEMLLADMGKSAVERQLDELDRQNEKYREQLDLLRQVAREKSEKIQGEISGLEVAKMQSYQGSRSELDSEKEKTAAALEEAKKRRDILTEDQAGLAKWKKQGNELFDEDQFNNINLELLFVNSQVDALTQSLEQLSGLKTSAELQLDIDAKYDELSAAGQEMNDLQSRLESYENNLERQRQKIASAESESVMADIRAADQRRATDRTEQQWQSSLDAIFSSGNFAEALAKATEAMQGEKGREDTLRQAIDDALRENDPQSLRDLSEELRAVLARQDHISHLVAKAESAQANAASFAVEQARQPLGSFITADILNLLGGPNKPEEETARNTRATAANLAKLIDLFRRTENPTFT